MEPRPEHPRAAGDQRSARDETPEALTVAQLTQDIKSLLHAHFPAIWVRGEISDLARPRSGHIYLTLKDDVAQIKGVIWRSDAQRIKVPLDDGMEVLCAGGIDLYAPRGSYQLVIRKVEPLGEGAMQRALRQLQTRLAAEGLFDTAYKQNLPRYPSHVAVVTSPSGAAIQDFLEVARRRWCGCQLTVVPCLVQGDAAVADISRAIGLAERLNPRPDVVVITRGGGSMEDLWCFNSEAVVRAIHACTIPTISAVGHEIDVTLADMVADLRALTPTEAAERVVPDQSETKQQLRMMSDRFDAGIRARLEAARQRVEALTRRRVMQAPLDRVRELARRLDELEQRTHRAAKLSMQRHRDLVSHAGVRLNALSPLAVLSRGYSYTQSDSGNVIQDASQVSQGDRIITTLNRGRFVSSVESVEVQQANTQVTEGTSR